MTDLRGLPRNEVLIGDAETRLSELPDESIDTCITSPPYFALRDYGHTGQLGLEADVNGWVKGLLSVTTEIRRILKPTGALWLNLGDSFAHHPREGAAKKSLLMAPERLALAMTRSGWLLRNKVIWAKTNPMPSNVTDRLSATHEYLYFFTKSPKYFFDLNAIRVPHKDSRVHGGRTAERERVYPPPGALPRREDRPGNYNSGLAALTKAGLVGHPLGKNPGDVWSMGTASFHGDHFAVFPETLVERPLRATCPERVCDSCGRPWTPSTQRHGDRMLAVGPLTPTCGCGAGWQPGVVLDPFFGAGTVALVAEQHRRDWLGVELNPDFAELALERLKSWRAQKKPKEP